MSSIPKLSVERIQEEIRERLADIRPWLNGFTVTIADDQILVNEVSNRLLKTGSSDEASESATDRTTE
jgi:hypothetical protein